VSIFNDGDISGIDHISTGKRLQLKYDTYDTYL